MLITDPVVALHAMSAVRKSIGSAALPLGEQSRRGAGVARMSHPL
jgi:hypothetical protein